MKVGIQTIDLTKAAPNGVCKPQKAPVYRQSYTHADIKQDVLVFYQEKSLSARQFCYKAKKTSIPFSTFHRHIRMSGLGLLRKQNKPVEQAEAVLNDYIGKLKQNTSKSNQESFREPPIPNRQRGASYSSILPRTGKYGTRCFETRGSNDDR
jgi:hypothetical protein